MKNDRIKPSRDIGNLLEIMAALRTPETGCPWDLEQDFKSIAPYTIEEAHEVADAIDRGDMEDLRLELGDLLLQSVYHARMAEEGGHFDFGDVVEGISRKMIRRHPHVFGSEDVNDESYSAKSLAKSTWEEIKAEEKRELDAARAARGLPEKEAGNSILDRVPRALPSLLQARKIQSVAAKAGFDWDEFGQVIGKLKEEIEELEEELSNSDRSSQKEEEEIGDILFSVINLARHLEIDCDSALRRTNIKFRNRFAHMEKSLSAQGRSLKETRLADLEALWVEAKTL